MVQKVVNTDKPFRLCYFRSIYKMQDSKVVLFGKPDALWSGIGIYIYDGPFKDGDYKENCLDDFTPEMRWAKLKKDKNNVMARLKDYGNYIEKEQRPIILDRQKNISGIALCLTN